ncbi:MAG: hypothetical protein ACYC5Z_09230 [Acidimicrobiales bacterium]
MISARWSRWAVVAALALSSATVIAPLRGAPPAGASGHLASEACAPSALTVLTWSNYASYAASTPVRLTAIVRNSGPSACRVTLGGSSPLVTVRGTDGSIAWASCGQMTPCPLYLMVATLAPGASRVQTWSWNQRTHGALAARGTYLVTTTASGTHSRLATSFRLGTRSTQPTVIASLTNSSRVIIARGATLVVRLGAQGLYVLSAPTSSPPLTARLSLGGATALALFVARSTGSTVVRATGTPACYPQCLMPSRLFQLRVTITR